MRLPPNHFLTKHYIERFNVDVRPFENINREGYLLVYGEKVKIKGKLNRFQKTLNETKKTICLLISELCN